MSTPLSRRDLLRRAGLVGAGAAAWRLLGGTALSAGAAPTFSNPVRFPSVRTGDVITLTAAVADLPLVPDRAGRPSQPTRVWAFDGEFPGPTIRRPAGARTLVEVRHRLPASVGSLTIHLHGGHTAARYDGQPERDVIEPGRDFTYRYDLWEDGAPERGCLQWYHDHSHLRTGRNVWNGLAGMFVITDDERDAVLGLPTGEHDLPFLLTDRQFDANDQMVYPFPADADRPNVGPGSPPLDDLALPVTLVNGTVDPYLAVEPRPYRFRFLSATSFQPYDLILRGPGNVLIPWRQVATESGLLPAPVTRGSLLLGPAERAEVVVDFGTFAGAALTLETVTTRSTVPRTAASHRPLMEIRVGGGPATTGPPLAPALRPLPAWVAQASPVPDRVWAFGMGIDPAGRASWTVNGRTFDHSRVDARVELGSVETWLLVNTSPTGTSHYVHIHAEDWKVLSRNGATPGPGEDGLKETFRLDPGEVVVLAARFTDHLGEFMIHCHMLEHEDHGMMTAYEIVPAGLGDRRRDPVPGVTSVPDEVVRIPVGGASAAVSLAAVEPHERPRVRAVLEGIAAAPGRPAPLDLPPPRLAPAPLVCDVREP